MFTKLVEALFGSGDEDIADSGPVKQGDGYTYDHYTEAVDNVKQLKREGDHDAAEDLLLWCIEQVEQEAFGSGGPNVIAPWYYRHLGIVYRKDQQYDDEVAVLERYMEACEDVGAEPKEELVSRLERANELAEK